MEHEHYDLDYEDDDDLFKKFTTGQTSSSMLAHSPIHSPFPQPYSSLRSSPQSAQTNSTCSINSIVNTGSPIMNDENDAHKLLVGRYYNELPPHVERRQPPRQQFIRDFNVDSHGCLVDCGFKLGRQSLPLTSKYMSYNNNNQLEISERGKDRRATCPEIWLSTADENPENRCTLRVFGASNTGKKTLAAQMAMHADIRAHQHMGFDLEEYNEPPISDVGFLLNGEEFQLEIIIGSAAPKHESQMTIYMVVYSVDNRDSFIRAAQILYRLHDSRRLFPGTPVVLIANKIDLQRRRKVTSLGRALQLENYLNMCV